MNQSPKMDLDKFSEQMRKLIEQENIVLNNRFTWFMASESLLFAALSFVWVNKINLLIYLLAFFGISMAVSCFIAVLLSEKAFLYLEELWRKKMHSYDGAPLVGYDVKNQKFLFWFFLPQWAMPFVFIFLWLIVVLIKILSSN